MKKTLFWIFAVAVVLGAAVAAWGIISFKGNAVKQSAEIYLSKHSDYATLIDSLKPKIGHHLAFDIYAKRLNLEQTYKAGHYVLDEGMNVIEIVRMIKLGIQTPINVTFNNAKTPAYLAGKLARQIDADSAEIAAV
ncbi:MAG: endolytic transglycosylase MltG, partial [Rikenellaceae bacterium]|nr:endolytic transglycosylase MltG [Rikenellaceae bacterium]